MCVRIPKTTSNPNSFPTFCLIMKSFFYSLIALSVAGAAHAATSYNFQDQSANDYFTNEVTGWTQSNLNPVGGDSTPRPLAYIASNAGNNFGVLGTAVGNHPTQATTTVTGALTPTNSLTNAIVSVDLSLFSNPSYSVYDSFAVSIGGTSDSAATITFTPGAAGVWALSYDFGGVTGSSSSTVTAGFLYNFQFIFGNGTTQVFYDGALVATAATSYSSAELVDSIAISHTQTGASSTWGHSSNGITFDNISVVPEPSVALLGAIGSLALLRRRRQA